MLNNNCVYEGNHAQSIRNTDQMSMGDEARGACSTGTESYNESYKMLRTVQRDDSLQQMFNQLFPDDVVRFSNRMERFADIVAVKNMKKVLALALSLYLSFSIPTSRLSNYAPDDNASFKAFAGESFVKTSKGSSTKTPESYELHASNATAETFSYAISQDPDNKHFDEKRNYKNPDAWNPFKEPYYLNEEDVYDNLSFDLENADQLSAKRVPGQVIIKFKNPDVVPGKEKQLQNEIDKMEKVGFVTVLDTFVVRIEDMEKDPNAVLNRLKNNRFIEYVEPDYILDYSLTPNDIYYKTQSAVLDMINASGGWEFTTGDNSPVVAIIDSGIAPHYDFPKLHSGFSAASNLAYSNDRVGHGTNVTGVLGALGNNEIGITGINWNATLMSVKVDDASGATKLSDIVKGIIWAADNGAKVINISLGLTANSTTLRDAIDYAYKNGCAIFAGAGNMGGSATLYPARYDNVMGVGATTDGKSRVSWSNYGEGLDVIAAGTYYTTTKSGGYAFTSGTSVSSPQVAGLASLILAINPSATPDEIYSYIRQGAKPLGDGYNKETGYGLVDVGNTLALVAAAGAPPAIQLYTKPPVVTLEGFTEINIFVGDNYEETGYAAIDCLGDDITDNVRVTGFVNTSKEGVYAITYSVTDNGDNSAKATRIITVSARPVEPPTITIIGSNPIILHLNSKTPYIEQSAKAFDTDGKDISRKVEVIGAPNRRKEGTYTITYRVVGKDGGIATAARTVHIVSSDYEEIVRTPYNLNGYVKHGETITYTDIVAADSGWMNLRVGSISNKMEIRVYFVNAANGRTVFIDTFSAIGGKQYRINKGIYKLIVTATKINGMGKYSIDLLMPETTIKGYAEDEILR